VINLYTLAEGILYTLAEGITYTLAEGIIEVSDPIKYSFGQKFATH